MLQSKASFIIQRLKSILTSIQLIFVIYSFIILAQLFLKSISKIKSKLMKSAHDVLNQEMNTFFPEHLGTYTLHKTS